VAVSSYEYDQWNGVICIGQVLFFDTERSGQPDLFHVALRGHEAEGVLIPFCAVFFSHVGGGKMLVPHHLGLQAAS